MNLIDLILQLEPERTLWSFHDKEINAKKLLDSVRLCQQALECTTNSRIALEISDSASALTWMLALDGIANTVFLVPDSLRISDAYEELIERFNADIIIKDTVSFSSTVSNTDELEVVRGGVSTRWVLATSGTTGIPKLIEHTSESLTRTCKLDTHRGRDYTWGLVYDPFRFAGLQVVLQALASGSHLVFANALPTVSVQASLMQNKGVNALSATPSYWRKLLMSKELKGHALNQITLGGEPVDQTILNALSLSFPEARITHIYASTEAGVGFSVTDGQAGFPKEYLEEGVGGNQLALNSRGTLMIKPAGSEGYIDTGDLVVLRDERLYFLGRDSGAINVGGNKVVPEEVEEIIRQLEGVAEVVVKPKDSGVLGQLVTAEVKLSKSQEDPKQFKKLIMAHCRNNLERFKVPALIRFVEEIDSNSTGKIKREQLS